MIPTLILSGRSPNCGVKASTRDGKQTIQTSNRDQGSPCKEIQSLAEGEVNEIGAFFAKGEAEVKKNLDLFCQKSGGNE